MTPPRIFCLPAREAPVLAVLRRGPSDWCHVGRWEVSEPSYEPGAWFRGTIYPQKCDLSPDGRWLAYSAMKHGSEWGAGDVYEAISRLPWLHALAAWEAGTTYTRGIRFVEETGRNDVGPPVVGDVAPCLERYGLAVNRSVQFAVERRTGWRETDDTAERDPADIWDERRPVGMRKRRPGGDEELIVEGGFGAFRTSRGRRDPVRYTLATAEGSRDLDDLQWADWDGEGRLLAATRAGGLEMRTLGPAGFRTVFTRDLSPLVPDPEPAPEWARAW